MKTKVLAAAAFLPLAALCVEVDGIAARVNDAVILRSDVLGELRRSGLPETMYDRVRNDLVDRKLILKAASDAKMTMQDWVVENRVQEVIQHAFDGDRNKLIDQLAKQKTSYPEWRQRMQDDLVVQAMRWNTIDKNAAASPAAMKEEYEKHPDRYTIGRRVTVSVILLNPENRGKRAEVAEALKTETFADIARRYSADSHANEGGVWKDVDPAKVFRPEVCAEIEKMPKGTLSHWIDLDGWSFLLRKDAESEAKTRTFAEAYDDIEETVRAHEAQKSYDRWLDGLRSKSYIKLY